jgi:PKD repeat protein
MTLPQSQFPELLDSNNVLQEVKDGLRMILAKDYSPGDTVIYVDGNSSVMNLFPDVGIITLTEQCSDPKLRAISFLYNTKSNSGFYFTDLTLLDGFEDNAKPKDFTNVTLNVVAHHHEILKDSLINIETYLGITNSPDTNSLNYKLNKIKSVANKPKAWFSVNHFIGLTPFQVTFKNSSIVPTSVETTYLWDFGDSSTSTSSETYVNKTYTDSGKYTVSLTATNKYGETTCVFTDVITARIESPSEAIVNYNLKSSQIITDATFDLDGKIVTPPKVRAKINDIVSLYIEDGVNSLTGRSYAGEELVGMTPIDPIISYTWSLGDDLSHSTLSSTTVSYSIGGLYDLILRVDTEIGAYRITTYEDSLEIIETQNLWLWTLDDMGTIATAYEFGLLSETFRTGKTFVLSRDDSFLDGTNNEEYAKKEFSRNVSFCPRSNTYSGDRGTNMIFYASGGSTLSTQEIKTIEYEGFSDVYFTRTSISNRPWNWTMLASESKAYFIFGQDPSETVDNPSYQYKTTYNLSTLSNTVSSIASSSYENGASDLLYHVTVDEDNDDVPDYGYFATYRTAWKNQTGYLLRNDGVGSFFRIKSFYKTKGTIADPFQGITKLQDMPGTKTEGQLVPLNSGLFFFNNSGNIAAYNDTSSIWETGIVGSGTATFRNFQDTSIDGYGETSNSLLAASDKERIAILSFDYSNNKTFIKFNLADITFTSMGSRPFGEQLIMGVY